MSVPLLVGFAGLCLLLAATPGPDTFLVLRFGLGGARFGIAAALGSGVGSLLWAVLVALGVATLLQSSAVAFGAVKAIGGLYLLYLGVSGFIRCRRVGADSEQLGRRKPAASLWTALTTGLVSCAANPKVGLFFLAVAPQFLPPNTSNFGSTMLLGAIDGVIAVLWLTAVALGAATAVDWIARPKVTRRLDEISSGVLVLLGIGTLATSTAW